jgi:hypothetical protein
MDIPLELYAFNFCGSCKKGMMMFFERQFPKKQILRYEEDGA